MFFAEQSGRIERSHLLLVKPNPSVFGIQRHRCLSVGGVVDDGICGLVGHGYKKIESLLTFNVRPRVLE